MKKVLAGACALLVATAAWASCRYYTYTIGNKTYFCTECCYGTGPARTCSTTCN